MHTHSLCTHHTSTSSSHTSDSPSHQPLRSLLLCTPSTVHLPFSHLIISYTYKLYVFAPISVPSTVLITFVDKLIQSSEHPYPVSTVIIISIFIYMRKLRHREVNHLPGVTHPVGGWGGIGTWAGWLYCLSTETDMEEGMALQFCHTYKVIIPVLHVHTSTKTQKSHWWQTYRDIPGCSIRWNLLCVLVD